MQPQRQGINACLSGQQPGAADSRAQGAAVFVAESPRPPFGWFRESPGNRIQRQTVRRHGYGLRGFLFLIQCFSSIALFIIFLFSILLLILFFSFSGVALAGLVLSPLSFHPRHCRSWRFLSFNHWSSGLCAILLFSFLSFCYSPPLSNTIDAKVRRFFLYFNLVHFRSRRPLNS